MTAPSTGPLDRRADPLATQAMTDQDIARVRAWLGLELRNGTLDYDVVTGVADLLHEIDRARAAEHAVKMKALEAVHAKVDADGCAERDAADRRLHKGHGQESGQ